MSYPLDDAEQLIANAEAQMPPSTRSRLIAKLRMGKHIDDAAKELDISPKQVFSTARVLKPFGEQLDATLTSQRDPSLPHGSVTGYNKRCRCPECRGALQQRV
ncbi:MULTISPECIES: hypothetical protein [Nocardiopsis]|jgi:DNA-directed RNA polymerase beta subunit|uniref:Uncharacterized protein n=1 Tax=Nocardiopsis eucommiae TaxID=2831970 RepID=A0A975LAH0_9ACTN|nr:MULTISPECIES: hypothetical protein [Nocardiopsis]MBQ1083342.1 hypothetical protein [Nocardiopsis sp. B62]PWV45324.1 hypothetical protein BDW27_11894 [Nocardiopsis sp. L17-MgMaSL7]QVJ01602.1 hypothetical protein KGD82_00020 [Nocardiopsis eucommiae]